MFFIYSDSGYAGAVRCRFSSTGCPYKLPSMEYHEDKLCQYRPTRCPSLTCPMKPAYAKLIHHIEVIPSLTWFDFKYLGKSESGIYQFGTMNVFFSNSLAKQKMHSHLILTQF